MKNTDKNIELLQKNKKNMRCISAPRNLANERNIIIGINIEITNNISEFMCIFASEKTI